jgi:hypothetical protein
MTLLTPTDIAAGALKRGTAAYDRHFPKLSEQRAPALIPGSPKQVVKPADSAPDIPAVVPPSDAAPSTSSGIPPVPLGRPVPPPPLRPLVKASASSSRPLAEPPLPDLTIEARFNSAITHKFDEAQLNDLAIQAAREIRTRDESQWAPLLTRCTKSLAHCARKISEDRDVNWNGLRASADVLLTKEIKKVIDARPVDGDEGRRHLATLFGFVISEQVFSEGNNRGAYFLVLMVGEFQKIALPAQEKFKGRDKDESGFFKKKIAQQFVDMY